MGRFDTDRSQGLRRVAVLALACVSAASSQTLDWRPVGNTLIDAALASPATGPVERVWYSAGGDKIFLRTSRGKVFETGDSFRGREVLAKISRHLHGLSARHDTCIKKKGVPPAQAGITPFLDVWIF